MYILLPQFIMKYIKCLGMALIFLGLNTLYAQQFVEGKVLDLHNKQPLMGVNIMTPDTTQTTITNADGFFKLKLTEGETLVFSYLGYRTQQIQSQPGKPMAVYMEPDDVVLGEILVQAFNIARKNKDVPAAVATLDEQQLNAGNGISLQPSLNSIPGVKMDQSAPSDSRISIRGSGVRAPWAIRNLKMYINDIPITEADGTTRIESINISDLGNAEIVKGPASSVYGGGSIGGVINLQIKKAKRDDHSLSLNAMIGAHGLRKMGGTYQSATEKISSYLSYGYMEYDGYRNHNSDLRRFLTGNFQFYPSEKQTLTLLVSRTSEDSQIPGALTKQQVKENPKQAAAENEAKKAGRFQNWTRVGLGNQYDFNEHFSNTTSVFTYFYDLDHPLSYAYIKNYYQSYGGRTHFNYNPKWNLLNTQFVAGGEFNQANSKGTQYENIAGETGDLNSNVDNVNTYYTVFLQTETSLTERFRLTLGASMNRLKYDITDYLDQTKTGVKDFKTQFSPRFALSYDFGDFLSLHTGISSGFAPPTSNEVSLPDGSINTHLEGEKAVNYEINAKGSFLSHRLNYDLALYHLDMKNELIEQTVGQNVSVYHNSGRSTHKGVELALSYQLIRKSDGKWFTAVKPFLAATYAHYRFDDFKMLNDQDQITENFKNNELPGISPWMLFMGIDLQTEVGLYFNAHYTFNDKAPLNNANTDYNPSHQLVDFKLGYQKPLGEHFDLEVYAGVNNVFNKAYSSYTSLNAVAWGGGEPAYFQPSPKRNGYVGLDLSYKLN